MADFSQREPSGYLRARAGDRFIWLLWAQLLIGTLAVSQQTAGPFGAVAETDMPSPPRGLAVVNGPRGRAELLVSVPSPPALLSLALTDSGTLARRSSWKLERPIHQMASADFDRDGVPEVVGFDEGDPAIVILRRGPSAIQQVRVPLDAPFEKFLVADINNDGRMDLLLFGRNAAGMSVLCGEAEGTFTSPVVLFEDVSISDAGVTDLNSDGIADVFLLNWLSNSLEVSFGIGNLVFSSQVTITLGAEPAAIALAPVSRNRLLQLAIALADVPSVAIIRGNGAGEFARKGNIALPGPASGIQFGSLNDDLFPDLVIAVPSGMLTSFGRRDGSFTAPLGHGIRPATGLWKLRDVNGNRKADLVFVDKDGRRLAVASDAAPLKRRFPPAVYVAGPEPAGITIVDVTRDGLADMVVANRGGSTVSVFVNRKGADFAPHRQSPVSDSPGQIWTIAPSGSPWTNLLTAHRTAERVSVVKLRPDGFAAGLFSIPTASDPRILAAAETGADSGMRILVQNGESDNNSATFSLFEQISGATFVERSYRPGSPDGGRWVSVADFGHAGDTDVMVLLRMKNGDSSQIAMARTGDGLSLSAVRPVVTFPDSGSGPRFLLTGDMNEDGRLDLLVARSGSAPSLGVFLSGPHTGAQGPPRWISNVRISSLELAVLVDADQDGNRDVVYYDPNRKIVLALYGLGGGELASPRPVARFASVGGLAVGPLRGTGMNDLAVTDPEHGCVRIVYDPF